MALSEQQRERAARTRQRILATLGGGVGGVLAGEATYRAAQGARTSQRNRAVNKMVRRMKPLHARAQEVLKKQAGKKAAERYGRIFNSREDRRFFSATTKLWPRWAPLGQGKRAGLLAAGAVGGGVLGYAASRLYQRGASRAGSAGRGAAFAG